MTPAAKLQRYLRGLVEGSGGCYRKMEWTGRNGAPDCFVWWSGGRFGLIEIKAGRDRLSTVQVNECNKMKEAGLPVFVARTEEDVYAIVKKVRDGVDID